RHCMTIEGEVQQLPLFEPPIDPALLIQAAAQGIDLGSALADINAATPFYRFTYLLQKAVEFCAEVKSLGTAILSALEKKDAEALAALRASHETDMLNAIRAVKELQIEEAQDTLAGLRRSRDVTQARFEYYDGLMKPADQPPYLSSYEAIHLGMLFEANARQRDAKDYEILAQILGIIPNFTWGASGASPVVTFSLGGPALAAAAQAYARYLTFQ